MYIIKLSASIENNSKTETLVDRVRILRLSYCRKLKWLL